MKRIVYFLIFAVMSVLWTGCGGTDIKTDFFRNYPDELSVEVGTMLSLPEYTGEYNVEISVNDPHGRVVGTSGDTFTVQSTGKYTVNYYLTYNGEKYTHRTVVNVGKSADFNFSVSDGTVYRREGADFRILQIFL